jgi:hypothetical protein
MSNTKQVFISAIIAAIATAVGLIAINPIGGSSVQANQGGRGSAQKWEYCAIISAGLGTGNSSDRGVAVIRYFFQAGGLKEETVEFVPDAGKRNFFLTDEALDKAIAKLGDEGWEMVLKEPDTEDRPRTIFYFKRPKQ